MNTLKETCLFTSESVSPGHPDKLADRISDRILDECLRQDPDSRVACECLITRQKLVIAGEISGRISIDPPALAREVIRSTGYTSEEEGFDPDTAEYHCFINQQSGEISRSVADGGAGDQGMMFGYACDETEQLMPLPIQMAHALTRNYARLLTGGETPWFLPDAKSQVTVRYESGKPVSVEKIVFSAQHAPDADLTDFRENLIRLIIKGVTNNYTSHSDPELIINPSGSFTIGGPAADTGLTGRKIVADTYGGSCPHGGGAFSGKDPSKVDRSAAYAARFLACQVVRAGLANRCTVQVCYAIGLRKPLAVCLNTHGTGLVEDRLIGERLTQLVDLSPNGIISRFDLKRPIYYPTASNGHFGNPAFPWEQADLRVIKSLRKLIQ